jgi:hypothetical protein
VFGNLDGCRVFGEQDFAVAVPPEDVANLFAEPVYLLLPFVADKVRQGNMESFMAQDFKVLLGT